MDFQDLPPERKCAPTRNACSNEKVHLNCVKAGVDPVQIPSDPIESDSFGDVEAVADECRDIGAVSGGREDLLLPDIGPESREHLPNFSGTNHSTSK